MAKGCPRLLFFFAIVVLALAIDDPQENFLFHNCSNNTGNYTSNSAYGMNLNNILSSIFNNTVIDYGFYNESAGQEPDKANAIAHCRGDVRPDRCLYCIRTAIQKILQLCPNQKEAIVWYDECMVRYSNRYILRKVETGPTFYLWNPTNVTVDVSAFNQRLQDFMTRLGMTAASENSPRKFEVGETTVSFQTIYASVQCTPDLPQLQCLDCLDGAIRQFPDCCDAKIGARVLKPSCIVRYEPYIFYDPPANSPPLSILAPPPASPPPDEGFILS